MSSIPPKVYDSEDPRVEVLFGSLEGQYISTYLIGKRLGKGSFGSVFEAYDCRS
jgi:hypothetical protein